MLGQPSPASLISGSDMYNNDNSQAEDKTQNSTPSHWKPQSIGDAIDGTLIGVVKVRVGRRKLPAAIIRDENGDEWSVLLTYTVLKAKWNELNPRPGMHVEIVYLGDQESMRSGNFYKNFDLTAR